MGVAAQPKVGGVASVAGSERPRAREPDRWQGEPLAVELLVDAFAGIDPRTDGEVFCRRLCETFIDATPVTRVAIVLADGTHSTIATRTGSAPADAAGLPLVGPVVRIEPRREPAVSALGVTTITPLSAGGCWLGAVVADRGGTPFLLTPAEQRLMAGVARMIAVAAGSWLAMRRRSEALLAEERTHLAQEIHDRVVQDLFGASLVLSAPTRLSGHEQATCEKSLSRALGELEGILHAWVADCEEAPPAVEPLDLRPLQQRYSDLPVTWTWSAPTSFPPPAAALVLDFLDEALRNVRKHALPHAVEVVGRHTHAGTTVEVRNDRRRAGAATSGAAARAGLGLRLLAVRARQQGAAVESHPLPGGRWCTSLLLGRGA